MRNLLIVSVVIYLISLQAKASISGQQEQEDKEKSNLGPLPNGDSENNGASFKLSGMFKFERFKSFYNKQYRSTIEEMLKNRVFLARSYQVFLSAVAYSYRMKSYYLKMGERSDWLPEELEAMRNRHTMSKLKKSEQAIETKPLNMDHLELVAPEELEAELENIREKAKHEPDYKKLANELNKLTADESTARTIRKRRSVDSGETTGNRRAGFSIGQAFELVSDNPAPNSGDQMEPPASNNPDWEPPEFDTTGSRNYKEEEGYKSLLIRQVYSGNYRTYENLPVKSKHELISKAALMTQAFMSEQMRARQSSERVTKLRKAKKDSSGDDVVWVDHRAGGCMQPIQNQGFCGSCYAFSAMAFLEWLHCMETEQRVKFSEQYLVDCGSVAKMHACDGSNYYQNPCPYNQGEEMNKMGYLRADVSNMLAIELKYAERYLELSPLLVDIRTTNEFDYYGGGVYDGKECLKKNDSDHSVLMIGHGREDGEEYWLLRNSHGRGWGEEGYMKLNKNSKCIDPEEGLIYGSSGGRAVSLKASRNNHLSEPIKPVPKFRPVLALLSKVAIEG